LSCEIIKNYKSLNIEIRIASGTSRMAIFNIKEVIPGRHIRQQAIAERDTRCLFYKGNQNSGKNDIGN